MGKRERSAERVAARWPEERIRNAGKRRKSDGDGDGDGDDIEGGGGEVRSEMAFGNRMGGVVGVLNGRAVAFVDV